MARHFCRAEDLPSELLDDLDRLGFISRPPTTLAAARHVLSLVGKFSADTLKAPGDIDGAARAAKRVDKAERRASLVARGLASPSPSEERRGERIVAGKWRNGVKIEVRLCSWHLCGKILLADSSLTVKPERHRACMIEAMRTDEAHEFLSKRRALRDSDVPAFQINRVTGGPSLPVPSVRSRIHPGLLRRDFVWAVRHYLGDETLTALAAESEPAVSRQAVKNAIDHIIDLLPPPEFVPKKFQPAIEGLRRRSGATSFVSPPRVAGASKRPRADAKRVQLARANAQQGMEELRRMMES